MWINIWFTLTTPKPGMPSESSKHLEALHRATFGYKSRQMQLQVAHTRHIGIPKQAAKQPSKPSRVMSGQVRCVSELPQKTTEVTSKCKYQVISRKRTSAPFLSMSCTYPMLYSCHRSHNFFSSKTSSPFLGVSKLGILQNH